METDKSWKLQPPAKSFPDRFLSIFQPEKCTIEPSPCVPDWVALTNISTGTAVRIGWLCHHIDWHSSPESFQQNSPDTTVGTVGNFGTKKMDWLENSNSSVILNDRKLAQLIGNRRKQQTRSTSKIFSRQIPPDFPATSKH